MKTKLLHEADGKRTFAVVLQTDDEAMRCLREFAEKEGIGGAQVTAIGALRRAKLAYFDWETKAYQAIEVGDQVEVASLVGDIAIGPDGKPSVHVHAVLGRWDGSAVAGHLQEAHVRPTLEIIVTESPAPSLQGDGRRERSGAHQALKRLLAAAAALLVRAGCARPAGLSSWPSPRPPSGRSALPHGTA